MNDEIRMWGIHTPIQNDSLFLQDNKIAIGWKEVGNLAGLETSRDVFREKYASTYPDASCQGLF